MENGRGWIRADISAGSVASQPASRRGCTQEGKDCRDQEALDKSLSDNCIDLFFKNSMQNLGRIYGQL